MSLIDLLFRRLRQQPARVEVDLTALRAHLTDGAARLAGKTMEMDLVGAQCADRLRDLGLTPPMPDDFERHSLGFDQDGWRRLTLLASTAELPAVGEALRVLYGKGQKGEDLVQALVEVVERTSLLTLELLRQSPFRIEELARMFLVRIGAAVQGESDAQSRARLIRLDYARLLAEAEKAKVSAEERMEYLRRLQEEQDANRPRRGKW